MVRILQAQKICRFGLISQTHLTLLIFCISTITYDKEDHELDGIVLHTFQ